MMPTARADRYRDLGLAERAVVWLRRLPIGGARVPLRCLYRGMLSVLTLGRGFRCDLPSGERVFVSPAYRYMSWNPHEYRAFRAATKPNAVALDIGANVGAYTLLLAQWVGRGGRVFAFEPAPAPYEGLCEHIRLNGVSDVVTPVRAAVASAVRTERFVVAATAGESRLAAVADHARDTVPVAATTIDAFCAERGITPDFIKIDVEGAEVDVLRGARETIARGGNRLALFVEMHPSQWSERGMSRDDVERELAVQHLEIVPLGPSGDPWALEGICLRLRRRT